MTAIRCPYCSGKGKRSQTFDCNCPTREVGGWHAADCPSTTRVIDCPECGGTGRWESAPAA